MLLEIMQNKQIITCSEMTPHSYRLRLGYLVSFYPRLLSAEAGFAWAAYILGSRTASYDSTAIICS